MMSVYENGTSSTSPIADVAVAITTTQLPRETRMAHGTDLRTREHVIVRLTDRDGVQGFGEASPLTFFTGETAETTRYAVDHLLGPLVLQRYPQEVGGIHRLWKREYPGYHAAKAALDVALHDLLARRSGVSVADLLGGSERASVPVYKAVGYGSADDVLAEAESLWDLGLRALKVKIGEGYDHDLRKLQVLRERFGDQLEIVVDANGGYTPQSAVRFLRAVEPLGVAYVEQPVPADDIEGLAFVRNHSYTPVMADESLFSLRNAVRLIQGGAVDLLGIKLIKTAGLYHARKIAEFAEEFGVRCVVISPFDTEIGIAASAQFASTLPPTGEAHGLGSFLVTERARDSSFHLRDGAMPVPRGPGLGVEPSSSLFQAGAPQ